MRGRLDKFLRLKRREKFLLLRAFLLLGIVRLILLILPSQFLLEMQDARYARLAATNIHQYSPMQIAWAVTVASKYIPSGTCLSQAMTAKILLAKYGYPSNLQIGVAKDDMGKLEAHAWVECAGEVVLGGTNSSRYARLPSLEREM